VPSAPGPDTLDEGIDVEVEVEVDTTAVVTVACEVGGARSVVVQPPIAVDTAITETNSGLRRRLAILM
jgi:hypothetical protein